MKRMTALLLSLMLLLTPVVHMNASAEYAASSLTTENALGHFIGSIVRTLKGETAGVNFTLSAPNGINAGVGASTVSGSECAYFTAEDVSLLITGATTYLTNDGKSYGVESTALLNTLMELSGAQNVPSFTEAEMQLLAQIAMELVSGVMRSGCISYNARNSIMNLHIDLDAMLKQLDTLLPQVLTAHQAEVNALLAKYTPFIFGETVTLNQLLSAWNQLGLKDVSTGLVMDAMLYVGNTGMSLIVSCYGYELRVEMTNTAFAMTFTTPDGKVYPFNTNDLLTIANVFINMPLDISEEAFKFDQTSDQAARTVTTHITTNLEALEKDIVDALISSININSLSLDRLFSTYQPWFDLFFNSTPVTATSVNGTFEVAEVVSAPRITSAWLIEKLRSADFLPNITGEATVVVDNYNQYYTVDGYLGQLFFEADIASGRYSTTIDATLRTKKRMNPVAISLHGSAGRNFSNPVFTLSSSQSIFGINSITFSQVSNRDSYYTAQDTIAVTTTPDVLHFEMTENRSGNTLSMKLDRFTMDYQYHENTETAFIRTVWPDGYAELNASENAFKFASPWLGLSYEESDNVYRAEAYINEDASDMCPTYFTYTQDNENEIITASYIPYYDTAAHLTYRTGRLSILADGSELVIADTHNAVPNTNVTEVSFDGQLMATFTYSIVNGDDAIIRLIPANAKSADDCIQLTMDVGAPTVTAPAIVNTVTPAEFINQLNNAFYPEAQ